MVINWIDVIKGSWHVKLMSGLEIKEAWYWYEMRPYTHGFGNDQWYGFNMWYE